MMRVLGLMPISTSAVRGLVSLRNNGLPESYLVITRPVCGRGPDDICLAMIDHLEILSQVLVKAS